MYSAVVLNKKSHEKLVSFFKKLIPEDFEMIAHHMTINMGKIDSEYEKYLGDEVTLTVTHFAINDKVAAVKVEGFPSKNKIPHITLGVNRKNGGKPVMSNDLIGWIPLSKYSMPQIKLYGKVKEVK